MFRRCLSTASAGASKPPPKPNTGLKWALGLGAAGAAGFAWTRYKKEAAPTTPAAKPKTLGLEPLPSDTQVVFVLGGPGAGKGTQCANIVRDFGFVHLSAGDLLREERNRKGSPYGDLINEIIKEGKIVPLEITIALLHAAMKKSNSNKFLIDGFPRAIDQAEKFEEEVCQSKMVLYFECPEEEMLRRLLKRGETSGRVDDNIESINKRFATFRDTSYPVIEKYDKLGRVKKVSCMNTVDNVYQETKKIIETLKSS
ncbi:hypothetical protein HDV05_005788 [Chytridiales sp. JEL 0842]|nr:hypothetical protein HDV05_005788 [Chytridiales sp. JEL 0842]